MSLELPERWSRVAIAAVTPEVDGGKYPAKAVRGDEVVVEADVFCDGHDRPRAVLLWKKHADAEWREADMRWVSGDRFRGAFPVADAGEYVFTICGWVDAFGTFRHDLSRRIEAGQDVSTELLVGAALVRTAMQATGPSAELARAAEALTDSSTDTASRAAFALGDELLSLMTVADPRAHASRYEPELRIVVDVPRARFSAWYELFPRSTAPEGGRHGTLADVEAELPRIAEMGFDVLYLPPIHPIGRTYRKGKNNTPVAEADDVGSPWGIGAKEGGHKAVHPDLGTVEDLRRLVVAARSHGIEIALDVALQVSPDHPYVREHPEWFRKRPDGTIQYAENPPKKYQDIYPFDFECEDYRSLFRELKSIFEFWVAQGVRIFRVDNPHTKPFRFWEWCIADLKKAHPDLVFLSEAFTRPAVMQHLAKVGFTQSYTYFPWRNEKLELAAYFTELSRSPLRYFFRANHWPNTPDILPQFLQYGGRSAFVIRFLLSATLASSYGIYGPAFELCEARALEEGREEYLDSEKYQLRSWDTQRSDSLAPLIARLNQTRRENEALQRDDNLTFHPTDNDRIIAYSKSSRDNKNVILCIVNLDPYHRHAGWVDLDLAALGLAGDERYQVHDLISGAHYAWQGSRNYIELDPHTMPAHVFKVRKSSRTEADFEYFL